MKEEKRICRDLECEPPYGGKEACEFYKNGCCIAPIQLDTASIEKRDPRTLQNYGVLVRNS